MNPCTLLLCWSLSVGAPLPPARFVAEDKWQHFFTSFVITSIAASGARFAGLEQAPSIAVGVSVGAGAGVYKEIRDARQPGRSASLADLVWDAAGVGLAAVVAFRTR
jgi:VanZ family protein